MDQNLTVFFEAMTSDHFSLSMHGLTTLPHFSVNTWLVSFQSHASMIDMIASCVIKEVFSSASCQPLLPAAIT